MRPLPFSHSALNCHDGCPSQYHHKYVLKDLPPEEKSEQQRWGTFVHKQFEYKLTRPGFELPPDLKIHEPFLDKMIVEGEAEGCTLIAERKIALSVKGQPCDYFDKTVPVWWRGVADAQILDQPNGRARIPDFKTGKKKDEWDQLAETAIWMFIKYPWLNLINAQFYWVTDQTVTKKIWARHEMDSLAAMFAPKLAAYVHSFKTETWTPKQSGLCKGWCPVTKCPFWEPKREKYR